MAARKKPSRKKTVSRTRKTSAKKKASKKKVTRKVAKKAAKRKTSRKKTTTKKASRKKASKKKKKTVRKKTSKKTTTRKKVSKKKPSRKKTSKTKAKKKPSKKRTSRKKVTSKTARNTTGKTGTAKASTKNNKKVTKRITAVNVTTRSAGPVRKRKKTTPDALIHGIEPYRPQKGEEYMSDRQLEHFRRILLAWKQELMQEVDRTVHHMQDEASNFPDPNDRATQESEFGLELRTRDRERKLLKKIAQAIARVDDGSYGFCEETGEEIGLQRLEARPVATLSVEAQERRELAERQYSDRDDQYR